MKNEMISMQCSVLVLVILNLPLNNGEDGNPRVLVAMLIQNGEQTLPYTLSYFTRLTYPKSQIDLFIRSGSNSDLTVDIIDTWLSDYGHLYNNVDKILPLSRYRKDKEAQKALNTVRKLGYKYLWFVDQNSFILHQDALQNLIEANKPIVAPALKDMTKHAYNFLLKDNNFSQNDFKKMNSSHCYKVNSVWSSILFNLGSSKMKNLSLLSNANSKSSNLEPYIGALEKNSNKYGIDIFICGDKKYGYFIPEGTAKSDIKIHLKTFKKERHFIHKPLNILNSLETFLNYPNERKFGLDHIYIINLARRPERKDVMMEQMKGIGLDAEFFVATDARDLNRSYLHSIGAHAIRGYDEPFLTEGAIATLLSHYSVWEDGIKNGYGKVLILEDDAIFTDSFPSTLPEMLSDVANVRLQWDLIFLGREVINSMHEKPNKRSEYLVDIFHSYGAFAYVLTLEGMRKLHQPDIIEYMVPVDDYILFKYLNDDDRPWYYWQIPYNHTMKAYSLADHIVNHSYDKSGSTDTKFGEQYHNFLSEKTFGRIPCDRHFNSKIPMEYRIFGT